MVELSAVYAGPVERDAPLAELTNFRLGGPGEWLLAPRSHEEVGAVLAWVAAEGLPLTILGEGSNVLIRDGGIRGAVLRIGKALGGLRWEGDAAVCGAGLASRKLARQAMDAGRGGFEWAAALPGSLGGAVAGNAGCFGGQMADCFQALRGWTREARLLALARGELDFGYRRSSLPEGAVITELTLRLPPLNAEERRQSEARYREVLAKRAGTQPEGRNTAGSTFKNPPGDWAGRLIEACGLKGRRVGGAAVSERHANFIVTDRSGAKARDVERLIEIIEAEVERQTGIRLEREIRIYGQA